ncbi:hypothetical protein KY328_01125 [Candidatus Woesearchaeota archaeon]|nr:hypothetical protein [Candidatus Woesearchaeota archaeon]MBW3021499.1 hypothetical protein [Candidatus Woesearchaeota archaeon]
MFGSAKGQIQLYLDPLIAIALIVLFLGFIYLQFGGATRSIQGQVVEFKEELDNEEFLLGLLKSPILDKDSKIFAGFSLADLIAMSVHRTEFEADVDAVVYNSIKRKTDAEWRFIVNAEGYTKGYQYYPSAAFRDPELVKGLRSVVSETQIPSLDGKEIKVSLVLIKKK